MGHPVFVKEIRPDSNEVVISEEDALFSSRILCGDVNYMGVSDLREGESFRCMAKVRYHHSPQEAVVEDYYTIKDAANRGMAEMLRHCYAVFETKPVLL